MWHDEYLLSIGAGGGGPCPADLFSALIPAMSYVQLDRPTRGDGRDRVTGERRRFVSRPVDLYCVDDEGRLRCQPGYLSRVVETAARLGYAADVRHVKFEGYPDARPGAFEPDYAGWAAGFDARHGQDEMAAAVVDNFYGRIDAGAGFGKTFASGSLGLLLPNAEIVFVAPTGAVARTAERHFLKTLPAGDVGVVGDGSRRRARVTIVVVNSLLTRAFEFRPDLLVVDECHAVVADKVAAAVATAGRRARIFGLSASMGPTASNKHMRLEGLYGPVVYAMSAVEATERGLVVPIRVVWHDVRIPVNPVAKLSDPVDRDRAGIWRNAARNDVVAGVARSYPDSERVLVLTATATHALELAKRLPDFHVCLGSLADRLKGRTIDSGDVDPARVHRTPREQDFARGAFQAGALPKLIGTDTLGIGFSPDACRVVVRADGREAGDKSIQSSGRPNRAHPDKEYGTVHDFVDQFDVGFHRRATARRAVYRKLGYEQFRADGTPVAGSPGG